MTELTHLLQETEGMHMFRGVGMEEKRPRLKVFGV